MRRLATSVAVHRPTGSVILPAGAVPSAADAKLITNPACWEDGELPDDADQPASSDVRPQISWRADEIKEWAEANGIDLGPAKKKADMLDVITVSLEGRKAPEGAGAADDDTEDSSDVPNADQEPGDEPQGDDDASGQGPVG